jgi:hypothetical protein
LSSPDRLEFRVVIDYERRKLTFIPRETSDAERHGCYGVVVPFDPAWEGDPVAKVATDLGDLVLVWDTGATASIVQDSLVANSVIGSDGLFRSDTFVLGGEEFGPVELRPFRFAEPAGVDGFVGYDFFAKHVVCVDFGGNKRSS